MPECQDGIPAASGTAEAAEEGASGTAEAAEEAAELKVDCTDAASATTPECNSMNDDADDMTGDDMTEDDMSDDDMPKAFLAETEEMIPADDEVTSLLETKVAGKHICHSS